MKHRKLFIGLIVALTIIVLMAPAVFAGTAFFNVQLPVLGVNGTLVSWKTKTNTTNGSVLGTSNEHFYLSNLYSCWIWTDLKFENSGNTVQFSPKIRVYDDTYDNWLGAYIEIDAVAGDQIRLRANHGLPISPYSYVRADWIYN